MNDSKGISIERTYLSKKTDEKNREIMEEGEKITSRPYLLSSLFISTVKDDTQDLDL